MRVQERDGGEATRQPRASAPWNGVPSQSPPPRECADDPALRYALLSATTMNRLANTPARIE